MEGQNASFLLISSWSCTAKFDDRAVAMPINWDCTIMFAFFLSIQATPLLMTHVYLGRVRSWIHLRTAKPQPSLPGPSLNLHNSPAERTSGRYNDIIRHRNTLLIQMTSAVSSIHLCGLTERNRTGSEEEANSVWSSVNSIGFPGNPMGCILEWKVQEKCLNMLVWNKKSCPNHTQTEGKAMQTSQKLISSMVFLQLLYF